MTLVSEYNYEEGKSPREYLSFSSKSKEGGSDISSVIKKEFTERELNDSVNPSRMLECLNEIAYPRKIVGYKIYKETDSLGKPYWNFSGCYESSKETSQKSSVETKLKNYGEWPKK